MNVSETLDALGVLVGELEQNHYDINLHIRHIRLAQSNDALQSELRSAYETFTTYFAAGDEVWVPLIEAKQLEVDWNSEGLREMLEGVLKLFERAEEDYSSIPILQKHLEFLIRVHAYFSSPECKHEYPDSGETFSMEWTREAVADVVAAGICHLPESDILWRLQRDWELEMLVKAGGIERRMLVSHIEELHLNRLQQPHPQHESTLQSYSSFTTSYKPAQEYESLLVAASKKRAKALKQLERREALEVALKQANFSLETYTQYIAFERRARQPDLSMMSGVYERAIAEAARRRFNEESGAEEALRLFWTGYIDALRINGGEDSQRIEVVLRATRSVPGSGEVWARYLRSSIQLKDPSEKLKSIPEAYDSAMATNLIQKDVNQIVPLALTRASYEVMGIDDYRGGDGEWVVLVEIIEGAIAMVRAASPTGDPMLRLEKSASEWYWGFECFDEALALWDATTKHYKTSYLAWTLYAQALTKNDDHSHARAIYKDIANKNIDWPEAIWEAWIGFEYVHGGFYDLEECLDRVERARAGVNAKRAKEAEQALEAMQVAAVQRSIQAPEPTSSNGDVVMADEGEVDSKKRKLEDGPGVEEHKKARTESKPAPPKRDRENSTVFVAELPSGTTTEELSGLFKDCGKIREVKITELPNTLVATVEFFDRDSVPMALTKDKKRLRRQEVAVHLAWRSTLYVTNFPEKVDDAFMRELFGQFGTIFDVRWPSKKFKNTRRFCYVQFSSPSSAEKALELHGRELESGLPLNVYISNPERKKERTDVDANERELYVAGMSKFTTKEDLENLFKTYGHVKEVRMATEHGHCKGFAFVEFTDEREATLALAANNHELKNRRIAVTIADSRVRARNRNTTSAAGLSQLAEARRRSVRIRNLPDATQEGLLQQALEKCVGGVRRVEVFVETGEAVVELENAAEAGKLLLRTDPIMFQGKPLELTEETGQTTQSKSKSSSRPMAPQGIFVPRVAGPSRPRAGLGHTRRPRLGAKEGGGGGEVKGGKGQDDFRKMLG